jgi:hypothetical protein
MIKKLLLLPILLSFQFCYSQSDSTLLQFIELVKKVQDDNSLTGDFIYKGSKATISEYSEYKTTIGKFIQIKWKGKNKNTITAIFHNSSGYQTRRIFNTYRHALKDYKIEKDKYCKQNYCYELKEDAKKPYILLYPIDDSQLREIN